MNMRKYRNLIKVLFIIFLASVFTGCGDAESTTSAVPAPKIEAIPETTSTEIAETEEEPVEAAVEAVESEEPAEPVLDESKYFVDGIFYPIEYARQLGYTIYDSIEATDCCSISHNGNEYYVALTWGACSMSYSTGNRCFRVFIAERLAPDFTPECQISTANVIESDSNYYLEAVMTLLEEVASGNTNNPMGWDISGVTISTQWYDCSPEYLENGFLKTNFDNPDNSTYVCRPYQ